MKIKLFILVLFFSSRIFCQENAVEKLITGTYSSENLFVDFSSFSEDSLNLLVEKLLTESFFSCQNNIGNYREFSKNIISRIKIFRFNDNEILNIKNISTMDIKNKCNSNLSHANYSIFSLSTFNPLIYRIDFVKQERQIFRLYNSNYIMLIEKK